MLPSGVLNKFVIFAEVELSKISTWGASKSNIKYSKMQFKIFF